MAQPEKKRWNFSLRTLLVSFILFTFAVYWIHDRYWVLHLTEVGRYPLIVDYSRSIEEGVVAGHYDWQDSAISSANFPMESDKSGQLKLEAIILQIDRYARSEEILKLMDEKGYRSGTIREFLSFNIAHPNYQYHNFFVALSSCWQSGDYWFVPYLGGWRGGRGLGLYCWFGGWYDRGHFLAFRK